MRARFRAAALLLLLAVACTDQGTAPTRTVPGAITLTPRFHATFPAGVIRPITRVRIIAVIAATGVELGRTELEVDPSLPDWELTFEVPIPPTPVPVLLLAELIHVGPEGPVVESSGRLGPITLTPGTNPVQTVPVYPGPLEYHALTGIRITAAPERLLEGETATAAAEVTGGAAPRLFWSTGDAAILTVNADGGLTAVGPGRTQLRVDAGPHADSVEVEVGARPARIVVDPGSATADRIGAELQFTATVEDPRGAPLALDVTWSVIAGSGVEHRGDGLFRVTGAGGATVQAALPGSDLTGTATIAVGLRPAAVAVTPATGLLVARGATLSLAAEVADGGGTAIPGVPVSWATSDPNVATVSTSGLVTAVADGTVTITARAELNGASAEGTALITVDRAPSDVVIVAGDGQSGTVGTALPLAPAVQVLDPAGEPLAGVSVTFSVADGGGSVSVGEAVTDGNGVASGGVWTLGTVAGSHSLVAEVDGLPPVHFGAEALAGPAADLAIVAGDGQVARPRRSVAESPTVRVTDTFGNPIAGVDVDFAVSAGNGSVSPASARTGADGTASAGWTLGDVGVNQLTASAAGFAVTFSAEARPGDPAQLLVVTGDGQSGVVATALPEVPSVRVTDVDGNPLGGVSVTFSAGTGGSVAVDVAVTDEEGVASAGAWTLGPVAGGQSLEAAAGELTASFTATARAGAPAVLELHAGDGQSAPAGTAVAVAPAVKVADAHGNPVADVAVSFDVTGGGGSVAGAAAAVTGADGIAAAGGWTLGNTVGVNTLVAAAGDLAPVTFTAQATAGEPAALVLVGGSGQTAITRQAVAVPPTVRVTDARSNPVAGVAVSFHVTAGGGSVTPSSVVTGADGTASTSWTLGSPGPQGLGATVDGLAAVDFSAVATPGPVAVLVVLDGDGQTAEAGQPVAIAPAVRVLDAFDNPVPDATVTFAVIDGGGSLTGATPVSGPDGIAAVASWTLGAPGANRISASAPGAEPVIFLATATASADPCVFAVTPGTPQPATFADGQCLFEGIPTHAFTLSLATAAPLALALDPPLGFRVAVERNGVQVFSGQTAGGEVGVIAAPAGDYTLRVRPENPATRGTYSFASMIGLPEPCSEMEALVPLAIAMELTGSSCPAPDGLVRHRFALKAPAGSAHRFTAAADGDVTLHTALGSPAPTSATETLPQMVLQPAGEEHFLVDVVGAPGTTYTLYIDPVAPAHALEIFEGNEQYAQVGHALPIAPAVRVLDEHGDPVPGIAVTFEILSGGGEVTNALVLSDASGIARIGAWRMGPVPGTNTLRAQVGSVASPTFTAEGVGDGTLEIVSGNGQIAEAGAALAAPLVARVLDGAGNPVPGIEVSWLVTAGGGSLEVTQATSDANGLVQASLTTGTIGGMNRVALQAGTRDVVEFRADAINGTLILFDDDLDLDNGGVAGGAVTSLRHWDVIEGTAALRGNGVDDAIPGNGLYVDVNGLIRTSRSFSVQPGNYLLVYHAGGQASGEVLDEVEGRLGGATSAFLAFGHHSSSFFRRAGSVHFDEPGMVPIEIQTYSASGAGILIDRVTLTRQGEPAELRKTIGSHGDLQTGTAGQPLAAPIVAALVDENGDPYAGRALTFTASDGGLLSAFGSTPAPSLTISSSNFGVGLVEWTLGPVAGTQSVTVSADGLPSLTYTATAVAAEPLRWTNATGGSWHTASNWDAGRVPTAADNVVIDAAGTYEVVISSDAGAAHVAVQPSSGTATLRVASTFASGTGVHIAEHGVLRVAGTLSTGGVVESHGHMSFESGGISGHVVNHGTVVMPPGGFFVGGFVNESGGVLTMSGNNGDASLNIAGSLANRGTIELQGTSWGGSIHVQGPTFTNEPGALLRTSGSSGTHQIIGALLNSGTIEIGRTTNVQNSGRTFDLLDGSISVASGNALRISDGTVALSGVAGLTGPGSIELSGTVSVELDGDVSLEAGGPVWTMPGNVNFGGAGTLTNRSLLTFSHDRVTVPFLNEGAVSMSGSQRGEFLAGFTNAAEGVVTLNGNNGNASLLVTGELVNHGAIELVASGWSGLIDAGLLTNYQTGIVTSAGTSGVNQLNTSIVNHGLFDIRYHASVNNADRTLGTSGGTFDVAAGVTLSIANGTVVIADASVFTGTGIIALVGNVSVDVNGDYTFAADGPQWTMPGNVQVTGTGTITNRSTLQPTHDQFHTPFINEGLITMTGSQTAFFLSDLTNGADGTIRLNGNNGNSILSVSGDLSNSGVIELIASGWAGSVNAAQLVNEESGVVTSSGSSGSNELHLPIINHGLFTIDHNTTVFNTDRVLGTAGGTFNITAGNTLAINNGRVAVTDATVFTGTGTISLQGNVAVDVTGDYAFATDGPVWSMPGSVDFFGEGTLTNYATLLPSGDRFHPAFINEGTISLAGSQSVSFMSDFTNGASGSLTLEGNNGNADISVTGAMANHGVIDLIASGWGGVITTDVLTNHDTGVITSSGSSGSNRFGSSIVNHGLVAIQHSTSVHNTERTLGTAGGTFDVAAGSTLSISGGTVAVADASVFTGTGTIELTGNVTVSMTGNYVLAADGPVWTLPGSVDFTGDGTLTNRTTLLPSGDRFHTPFINEGTIAMAGSQSAHFLGGFTNAADGAVTLTGNNGDATLDVTGELANYGAIDLVGTGWRGVVMAGQFINHQTGVVTALGSSPSRVNANVVNHGLLDFLQSATIDNLSRTLTAADGTIAIAAGQKLTVQNGTVALAGTSVFSGSGTMELAGTVTLAVTEDFTFVSDGPAWTMPGSVDVTGPGTLTSRTTLHPVSVRFHAPFVNQGAISLAGSQEADFFAGLTNGADGTVTLDGNNGNSTLTVGGALVNEGTLELTGTSWRGIVNAPTLHNAAGGSILTGGSNDLHQLNTVLTNDGSITLDRGMTLAATSALHTNGGLIVIGSGRTFIIDGSAFTNSGAGVIEGSGTVQTLSGATFVNDATLRPGGSTVGTLTVQGSVTFTGGSVLEVQIDGAAAGQYDVLNVTGTASMDGLLAVQRAPAYMPALGSVFDVVTAATVTGAFAGTSGTSIDETVFLDVSMQPTAVRITTTAVVN